MNANQFIAPLFSADGSLRSEAFEPSAMQLLDATKRWLRTTDRTMFLPLDLLLVLVQQREPEICGALERMVHRQERIAGIEEQLVQLARNIDRGGEGQAHLNVLSFSIGFSGVLSDAWDWVEEAGRTQIGYRDLVRTVRWRVEVQDSASIRWAIRKLIQPSSDRIFDSSGLLLEPLFSPRALRYLHRGMEMSVHSGLPFLGTPHLIAAMCAHRRSLLWRSSQRAAIDPLHVRDELLRIVGKHEPALPPFKLSRRTLTPRVVRILLVAHGQAKRGGRLIQEEDLLNAFLEDGGSSLELLRALGVASRMRDRLMQQPTPSRVSASRMKIGEFSRAPVQDKDEEATLQNIGTDLMVEAEAGRLSAVLGRDEELLQIIRILMRTEQRNPILTGAPGVGKTALAHALADAIHSANVPEMLRNMRVIEVSGAALMGGTSFRGELEDRIAKMLKEAEGDIILFMDEAHAIFAPTSTGGRPAEVPNHFKAALASGKIAVVAATTDSEYRRWFEQDAALARRFERVQIEELPTVVTRRILADLRDDWSRRYSVEIPDEAIDATVELSGRFLPDQSQPDKAKKLLMDATIARAIEQQGAGAPQMPMLGGTSLTRRDIAQTLAEKTGIPLSRILQEHTLWWQGLRERLSERVPGHTEVSATLSKHLLAWRIGSQATDRHAKTLIFNGPSSPAKEQFARAVVEELYGRPQAFLKLDMSDFQDAHSISRLVGTPPGYVGYEDEDALVTPLRRHPAQVVYFSDFHLCHPRIRDRLLRMLDDGEITDRHGMRAQGDHAVFILGVDTEAASTRIGFGAQSAEEQALANLAPALKRRVDGGTMHMVTFEDGKEELDSSVTVFLEEELERVRVDFLEGYGTALDIDAATLAYLHQQALDCRDALEVRRLVQQRIIRPAIAAMIDGTCALDGIQLHPRKDVAQASDDEVEAPIVIDP